MLGLEVLSLQSSLILLLICTVLLIRGYYSRGRLIVCLVLFIAFDATVFVTINFLGN